MILGTNTDVIIIQFSTSLLYRSNDEIHALYRSLNIDNAVKSWNLLCSGLPVVVGNKKTTNRVLVENIL
jgi:hypothetical protein